MTSREPFSILKRTSVGVGSGALTGEVDGPAVGSAALVDEVGIDDGVGWRAQPVIKSAAARPSATAIT
jgi:hypothetical protein